MHVNFISSVTDCYSLAPGTPYFAGRLSDVWSACVEIPQIKGLMDTHADLTLDRRVLLENLGCLTGSRSISLRIEGSVVAKCSSWCAINGEFRMVGEDARFNVVNKARFSFVITKDVFLLAREAHSSLPDDCWSESVACLLTSFNPRTLVTPKVPNSKGYADVCGMRYVLVESANGHLFEICGWDFFQP